MKTATLDLTTASPEETLRLGREIGLRLRAGDVVALSGELGAGKTLLSKGIASGLGIDPDEVVSPTFTLVNEHRGRLLLRHLDFYRLGDPEELFEIGVEEILDGAGDGNDGGAEGGSCAERSEAAVVEWAEKFENFLPKERLDVIIRPAGESARKVRVTGRGGYFSIVCEELRSVCEKWR